MGAFHEGHLQLMREARKECDVVVVSLFVNPTQFGPNEDFSRYPRDEDRDFQMAESVGVDWMFAPPVDVMYPRESSTRVVVGGVSDLWEGERRPGHFEGVGTVVAKLFHIVQPQVAYFGLKDLQQCAVIRQMVRDLNMPIELRFVETVREQDGLALSSRNRYLTAEERAEAPRLHRLLSKLAEAVGQEPGVGRSMIADARAELEHNGWKVDYLAMVDSLSMKPVQEPDPDTRIIAAATLGNTRLIDNVAVRG